MSEPAIRAELHITLKDSASAGLKSIEQTSVNTASKTASASVAAASKSAQAARDSASKSVAVVQAQHDQHIKAYQDIARSRETLGIRSEQTIRAEISKTEEAYRHLARSGDASARELARAQDVALAKVKALRKEMDGSNKPGTASTAGYIPGAAAAVGGAYMMTAPAVTRAMDYDHTVAGLTNTLFSDRDTAGRIAGKEEIKQAIQAALKVGGGTREQAAGTLSTLMGSGEFTKDQSYGLLKTIQKGATAAQADPSQIADIVLAAKRMGIKPEQMDKVISKAIRAGELGGFELADMAKHLPAALSSARGLGLTGMAGFERVLMSMQGSVLTAGTKDEAANNLINIFEKINSEDTAKDFKKQGIDLRGELAKGALRGEDTITTFTQLIDQLIAKDPKTKAVSQELDRLSKIAEDKKSPQREQALKQIQQIYSSGATGKVLQDRQALQGFRAESQASKTGLSTDVRKGLARDDKAQELETSYAVMNDTASAQTQRLENAKLEGQDAALTGAGGPLKSMFQGMVSAAEEFPLMTASVTAAKDALILLAGAAGINALLGGGKGGLPPLVGEKVGKVLPAASRALPTTLAALTGWELGYNVVGKPLARGIDGLVQSATGDKNQNLGGWIYDLLHSPALKPPEQKPSESHTRVDINLPPGATVKSQTTQSTGPIRTSINTGNLWGIL
ncbi:phage tail tape measure protein [Ferriphaselus sp. R-1]|uniref:phage tail tape measure protein n=1 Tax=Ferriphaselus sp. R-1 TaxID=1485544 RepID=UPI00054F4264|nr:phage tail tape measure protein [Ferriphaselus sp. R-1]